jgi:hypothetical protein
MARLPKREIEKIVERDMPGYTVVQQGAEGEDRARPAEPDETAPDIGALRQKYLGPDAASDEDAPDDDSPNTDDEIVVVQRKGAADRFGGQGRPKTVVVSGKSRKVIGSQG